MGYSLEYEEQFRILKNLENNLSDVEDELKILVAIVDFVNKAWASDAGEKYYIITAIQQVRKGLAKDIRELRTFSLSSKHYLNQMKEFEKYSPRIIKGSCSVSNVSASKSKKTKVLCNLTEMLDVQGKLKSCSRRLKRLAGSINNDLSKIDSTMASAVAGGKSAIKKNQKDISAQANYIDRIAKAISQIIDNYSNAEENVTKIADALENGKIATTTLSEILAEVDDTNFGKMVNKYIKMAQDVSLLETTWNALKNIRGGVSAAGDIADFIAFMCDGEKIDTFDDFKNLPFFKGVKRLANIEKLYGMYKTGDYEGITEFFGTEVLKQVYKANGLEGFTAAGYVTMSWNLVENALSGLDKYGNDPNLFRGLAKYTWHVTGWTLIESGTEIAYNGLSGVAGIVGVDLDKVYGGEGIDGFYKQAEELKNMMLAQGVSGWCSGVKIAARGIGKGTAKFVNGTKGFLSKMF